MYVFESSESSVFQSQDKPAFCFGPPDDDQLKHYPHPLYYVFPQLRGEIAEQYYPKILITKDYRRRPTRWCELPYRMTDRIQRLSLDARELITYYQWLHVYWPGQRPVACVSVDDDNLVELEDFPYLKYLELRWEPDCLLDIRNWTVLTEGTLREVMTALVFLPKQFQMVIYILAVEPVRATEVSWMRTT